MMVGQVIAMKAVDSATEDGSFLNQLIKIVTIIAILAGLAITALILFVVFNIWEAVGGTLEQIANVGSTVFGFGGISPAISIVTGLFSAFAIRR